MANVRQSRRASTTRSVVTSLLSLMLLAVALPAGVVAQDASPQPQDEQPGPAADRLLYNSFFVDRAPLDIQANNMDIYLYGLKTQAAKDLEGTEGVRLINAPATTVDLILNPAPAREGELNPFSIKAIRQAMQYLVNRDSIAQDVYLGAAQPMITQVGPSDPDFVTVYDIDRGSGITYDPEQARSQISAAMTDAGAELVNGVWSYGGKPVIIKLIGRVEDERRDIADMVRSELEQAGFQVAVTYDQFAAAVQKVYSTDPQAFEWHIYTEGWVRSAPNRYDVGNVNSFLAPWLGNMPGWKEQGFWQYQNPELDQLGQTLFRGQFKSLDDRNQIYRQMTKDGLDESVRIWLATVNNSFPVRTDVQDLTTDLVSGPRNPWALRAAYVPGTGDLRVGNQWVWTERTTYNPVGGLGDAYSRDLWRNLADPAITNDPFTGIPEPFRASYDVQTAGPDGTLDVPADALVWDVDSKTWVPVAPGTTAVSKVTYDYSKYLGSNWHDGQPITVADAVYDIAQSFDRAYDPNKAQIETALAVTARPYLETFKGFRLTADDKLEVYVDFWHFDDNYIGAYANPTSFDMPWEVKAAMDDLVFKQRKAAYTDTAASRFSVPWLSLVLKRDAGLVDRTLRSFTKDQYVPEGVFQFGDRNLVSTDDAMKRYSAAHQWFTDKGHLVISNGSFYLNQFDPPAQFAELLAFRDPTYPFKASDFYRGEPPQISIGDVNADTITAGQDAVITTSVSGPGTLGIQYLLIDPAYGTVIASGEATPTGSDGEFSVTIPADVTTNLFPGFYKLDLAAHSDELALVTERQVDLEVSL